MTHMWTVALAVVFGLVLILLAIEVVRVRRDIQFAKRLRAIGTGASPDHGAIDYVARVLAVSRRPSRARLIAKLFPIALEDTSDTKQLWSAWHRVHIPAYVMMRTRDDRERQAGVIESLFDGLTTSVRTVLERRRRDGDGLASWITFDEFWPVVECIEEAAVHTCPTNNDLFATQVAQFATRCVDDTVHAQLGWVVNELLERSRAEATLGLCIAKTLAARSIAARESLYTLIAYKRIKHGLFDEETLEGDAKALEDVLKNVDSVSLLQATDLHEHYEQQRRAVMREQAESVTRRIEDALGSPLDHLVRIAGSGCDEILTKATPCAGVDGVIALAAVRLVLHRMCEFIEPFDPPVASAVARGVCRWLMVRADAGKVPAFLVIESAESIRDDRSRDAAVAMASFLKSNPGSLDPGIAVCITEGVEDGLYEDDDHGTIAEKRARLRDARFTRDPERRWSVANMDPQLGDIRAFWRDAAEALQENTIRRDDVPHWMNVRLDLRRETAAA
jgi:hypothetical protein